MPPAPTRIEPARRPSSLHLTNVRVWTGDARRPWRDELAILDGRVVESPAALPPDVARLDGGGRFAMPGLIDAHLHLLEGGLALNRLDLSTVRDRDDFERRIADAHAALPDGRWLIANGWSHERWAGRTVPDKSWLRHAGDRPVVCYRTDLHAVLVNDAVLSRCDLDAAPPDGVVVRDERTGAPSGLLVEGAAWKLVNPIVPPPSPEERRQAYRAAKRHLLALGVTSVGSMEYERDLHGVYAPLHDELGLRCRVTLLDRGWPMDVSSGAAFAGDERLAVRGYKAFADGTLGSRSARLLAPYADDPGNRGMLVELVADGHLGAWARNVVAAGLSPAVHAIGDEAVRIALDALEPLRGEACCRIEHAQQVDPSDIPRFAGLVASMQPRHKADDGPFLARRLGAERLRGSFAFRALLDAGATLAFGSDWPVVTCDPMEGVAAAVTGIAIDGAVVCPEQNLTVTESLTAYTTGAATALGLEGAGVLRPGAHGDVVILDRDPFVIDWSGERPRVLRTIVGGVPIDAAAIDAAGA